MSDHITEPGAVELYTIPEAADVLRVPEGWLRKKVTAGAVPHARLGKHVRFTSDHLRRIIAAGDVEARPTTIVDRRGLSPRARRVGPAL